MKSYRVKDLFKVNQIGIPDFNSGYVVTQREWTAYFSKKKIRISIGNIDLFAYYIFKNSEILLGHGVAESEPNWYPTLSVVARL